MAQRLLSISLGTSSAKLAEIMKSGKNVQIFSAYDIQLTEGLCDDGTILDVDALAAELKQYISQYKIKAKALTFSIASKRIANKEAVIPLVKEKQIKSIVEINAPEYFPVSNIQDYSLNYSIIELLKTPENTQYRINVTATPNDMLESYEALAKAMKRPIEVIDYAGNAILQVLKSQIEPGAVNAILQLGYENVVINIMNGGVQIMQRSVAVGLRALINAVCENVGLDEEDAVAFLEDNEITRIAGAYPDVSYVFDQIISSIGRIFSFYNGRSADHPITAVKFIGDATYVNGIGDALEKGLDLPTEEIFTLKNVVVKSKTVTPESATNFIANIGTVIAPMNLRYVAADEKDASEKDGKLPWGLVILSVVAAIALVASTFLMYKSSQDEVETLEAQVNALASMRDLDKELKDTMAMSEAIAGFYDSTKGPNDSIPQLIIDLEAVMPKGTSINSLSIDDGHVIISAGGLGKKSVAKLITELKAIDYIDNVNVDFISEVNEGVGVYDSFTMSFDMKAPVEESDIIDFENSDEASENNESEIAVENEGGI